MKKKFIFIANWKMYLNFNQEIEFATSNYDNLLKLINKNNIILCPSFLNLKTLIQIFKETNVNICAQNCSDHCKGSYTGQISATSLSLANCKHCIIGHSESRKYLNENENDITEKFKQLINNYISPILCIGENEKDHKNQNTMNILDNQLKNILNIIKNNNIKQHIYIAYEPIWSIGTGKIANIDHLENIFAWIYEKIKKLTNKHIKLLYGGSVNSKNISILKKITNLDGFLIGKASLNFQEFKKIVKS